MEKRYNPLYSFATLVASATLILIAAGGLVTSFEAGLSVPDWPLSFGQFFPHMSGLMVWEHSHRVIAGFVGILSLVLMIWISMKDSRGWLKAMGWLTFGLVIAQALLGGLTVLMQLPPPVSIAHATIGQVFFGLLVAIAFFLSPYYENRSSAVLPRPSGLLRLGQAVVTLIVLQLILGAAERHTHRTVAEHIGFGFVLALVVFAFIVRVLREHSRQGYLAGLAVSLGFWLVIQVFLGIGAFAFKQSMPHLSGPPLGEVVFTAAHQTAGAVILGLAVLSLLLTRYPEKD